MKTISFELSKRLNELGLLDDIETEFCFFNTVWSEEYFQKSVSSKITEGEFYYIGDSGISDYKVSKKYKTLTLEEAIEFLPNIEHYFLQINKFENMFRIKYEDKSIINGVNSFISLSSMKSGETLLEAIEKLIVYLLDDNLLFKK